MELDKFNKQKMKERIREEDLKAEKDFYKNQSKEYN